MIRLILVAAGIGLGVVLLLVLWLALLPPEPRVQRIERPVPIDRGTPAPDPLPGGQPRR
jgi:hypothetical protein